MNAPQGQPRRTAPGHVLRELASRFGDACTTAAAALEHHGKDESWHAHAPPDAVVYPESTSDVAGIVKLCAAHRVPIIPFGAGTSLEGHVLAIHGGVCIDMTRMNRVLGIHVEDLDATVQAGVTRKQLNRELGGTGLFFPIDPGADATLAGMASTRASGTNAVRYGTMRENVLAITAVLADGAVVETARRARKSSAGYDLTRLLVGAEGTLGVITELTVKIYPQPEALSAATCTFPSVDGAVRTVMQTIQLGIPIARCELLDALTISAVNRYSKLGLREAPMLFCEFHGTAAGAAEQAQTVQEIAREHGGMDFQWATLQEDRTRLWQARHDAYPACLRLRPGNRAVATDVCVPISRLAECISATNEDIARASMPIALFGHVGDGNFHLVILIDPDNPRDIEEAEALNARVVERALAMNGTCTGEHGIGFGKIDFLRSELPSAVAPMRAIKRALDPHNIMNPEKWCHLIKRSLAAAALLAVATHAHAGTAGATTAPRAAADAGPAYPVKPVRVIIPFAAGGPADFLMRLVGPKLSEAWAHPVILDNRGGANQMLGSELAAKSPPDGYTLLMMTGGAAINVSLYPKVPYDTIRDFAPISLVAVGPNMAVIHPSVPARNLQEFIAYARSKPKQLVYASAGAGAPSHLSVELFSTMARIEMIHVPYKGMAPGMTDLLGGQVQLAFPTISAGIPHTRSGKLRALGVTTATRSPAAPDVPTIAEAALPGFEASNWYGLVAPARTPPAIVKKVHDDLARVLAMPDIREKMQSQGMDPASNTPEAFGAHIRAEIVKWAKVVKASGAKPE